MSDELSRALIERLTAMADDELILGHRNSEWTGHAPLLEEDIALANLAQDEIGHAATWYGLRSSLDGSDPDELVYRRGEGEYRNCRLVELPRGDWAFTMLRQFLFDAYEAELLPRLKVSAWSPLAEAAAKIANEELFHLRHSGLWLERLALGTAESQGRLERALALAAPALPGLLAAPPGGEALAEAGYFPASAELAAAVQGRLARKFSAVGLDAERWFRPLAEPVSRIAHGPELGELLGTMQSVFRADPEAASW